MNDPPFVYCYGIWPEHQPCLVRRLCQRHTRLRTEVTFNSPAEVRWHVCQLSGDHYLPVERANEDV